MKKIFKRKREMQRSMPAALTLRQCRAHLLVNGVAPSQPALTYHIRQGTLTPDRTIWSRSGKVVCYGFTRATVRAFALAVGWEYIP